MASISSSLRLVAAGFMALVLLCACGGSTNPAPDNPAPPVNPVPSVSTLTPAGVAAGSPMFTLMVAGSDFVSSSTVNWNGVALPTTYVSASELTASVPAAEVANVGDPSVTVISPGPGGGTSNVATFTISASNPVPSIAALSPASAASGNAGFTLTVSGSDFVASSSVNWNGVGLKTTYVSASQLTALVPAADIATVGTASVTVVSPSPGGGTSDAETFTINASNPLPSISSLSPMSVASGSTAFTLTVSGSDFVAASAVRWNGVALTTTYVSASQLTAVVLAADITTVGTASVTVVSPSPGGGTSNAETFTINASNPLPSISSLSPMSVASGSTAFTLTVSGSDFVAASAVRWNGVGAGDDLCQRLARSRRWYLRPMSRLPGTASVTVFNPAPGGGASDAASFTINASNPVPSVSSLSPASTTAGDAAFTLTVNGSDFVASSTVKWNGVVLATKYVSASQLTALVPASDITAAGTASVTVFNPAPGGGASNAEIFTINASGTGTRILQSGQYTGSSASVSSTTWNVTLSKAVRREARFTWWAHGRTSLNPYPVMNITDGKNTYTLLDRYNDKTVLNLGIQGTQSMAHWYAQNVPAGTYTINMAPPGGTSEDWVGIVVFEVAGVSATPLDGHTLNFQAGVPPGATRSMPPLPTPARAACRWR